MTWSKPWQNKEGEDIKSQYTHANIYTKNEVHEEITIAVDSQVAENIKLNNSNFNSKDVNGALEELLVNINDGKSKIADAINAQGVESSNLDTFSTLSNNISRILPEYSFSGYPMVKKGLKVAFITSDLNPSKGSWSETYLFPIKYVIETYLKQEVTYFDYNDLDSWQNFDFTTFDYVLFHNCGSNVSAERVEKIVEVNQQGIPIFITYNSSYESVENEGVDVRTFNSMPNIVSALGICNRFLYNQRSTANYALPSSNFNFPDTRLDEYHPFQKEIEIKNYYSTISNTSPRISINLGDSHWSNQMINAVGEMYLTASSIGGYNTSMLQLVQKGTITRTGVEAKSNIVIYPIRGHLANTDGILAFLYSISLLFKEVPPPKYTEFPLIPDTTIFNFAMPYYIVYKHQSQSHYTLIASTLPFEYRESDKTLRMLGQGPCLSLRFREDGTIPNIGYPAGAYYYDEFDKIEILASNYHIYYQGDYNKTTGIPRVYFQKTLHKQIETNIGFNLHDKLIPFIGINTRMKVRTPGKPLTKISLKINTITNSATIEAAPTWFELSDKDTGEILVMNAVASGEYTTISWEDAASTRENLELKFLQTVKQIDAIEITRETRVFSSKSSVSSYNSLGAIGLLRFY